MVIYIKIIIINIHLTKLSFSSFYTELTGVLYKIYHTSNPPICIVHYGWHIRPTTALWHTACIYGIHYRHAFSTQYRSATPKQFLGCPMVYHTTMELPKHFLIIISVNAIQVRHEYSICWKAWLTTSRTQRSLEYILLVLKQDNSGRDRWKPWRSFTWKLAFPEYWLCTWLKTGHWLQRARHKATRTNRISQDYRKCN